ncbi:hypothetical protein BH09CHL1_BH09CHL1_14800 [soil metagenome]
MRTAIGRAYYACFNLARLNLVSTNRLPALRRQNTHEVVWQLFAESANPMDLKIGQTGYRLRSFRNRSDYDQVFAHLSRDIDGIMRQAEQLIDNLTMLNQTTPPSADAP